MSPDQVLDEKIEIAKAIVERGRDLLGWWNPRRWAIDLLPSQVQAHVERWIEEAVSGATGAGPMPESQLVAVKISSSQQSLAEPGLGVAQSVSPIGQDSAAPNGKAVGMRRSELLKLRKKMRQDGIAVPPLEIPSRARTAIKPVAQRAHARGHWINSFTATCNYFGKPHKVLGCGCSSSQSIVVHRCNHPRGPAQCCLTDATLSRIRDLGDRLATASCEACSLRLDVPRFVTNAQYSQDIKQLASMVKGEVSLITGVSRSGLHAASMLAMLLHLPLDIVRQDQGDVISAGCGWRLKEGGPKSEGTVLVVDDTCMTGNSMRAIREQVRRHYASRTVLFAAVYVNPLSSAKPDFWSVDLPWPHILEWNVFNSVLLPACAMDFDGILCHDCPVGHDDDGDKYHSFLDSVAPLYPVRRQKIPLIVTARLEKYRSQTLKWLATWGIRVEELVMGPWATLHERNRSDVAAFKAEHFKRFMKRAVRPGPHLFFESDVRQAERIAKLSGGIVVCPAAGRCFRG